MPFEKLDFFDDESENDGSRSGSPGMFDFLFFFGKFVGSAGESIGSVSGISFGKFFLNGI